MRRALRATILALGLVLGLSLAVAEVAYAQAEDETAEGEDGEKKKKESTGSTLKTVGAYALGLVGVGILVVAVTKTAGGLSYPSARLSLIHLLRNSPNQAQMVALNMKGTFGEAIGAAMKTAAMGGSADPQVLSAATGPTYDATGQVIAMHWKGILGKGKLGVMAAGGGFVLGLTGDGFPVIPFILALVAVGCFARVFLYKNEIEATLIRARAEVLPEAERAMASGRYVFPPPPG